VVRSRSSARVAATSAWGRERRDSGEGKEVARAASWRARRPERVEKGAMREKRAASFFVGTP
jgi:hypothetical protein